jgi:hypothetical protein
MIAQRQASAAVGNLAGPAGRPRYGQTRENYQEPRPAASPTIRVDPQGTSDGDRILDAVGSSRDGRSQATSETRAPYPHDGLARQNSTVAQIARPRGPAPGEPVPQAAPRTSVETAFQPTATGFESAPIPTPVALGHITNWARHAVAGVLAGSFALAADHMAERAQAPSCFRTMRIRRSPRDEEGSVIRAYSRTSRKTSAQSHTPSLIGIGSQPSKRVRP